jgi:hypothetical protein
MRQIVQNYQVIAPIQPSAGEARGDSASPKEVIFHILQDPQKPVDVLDIGFGTGGLGRLIKANPATAHWSVDGVDGWEANCTNVALIEDRVYRHLWHGLAQDLPMEILSRYKILCLLDVIEHLNADTAKWLMRTLLTLLPRDAFLFVSTPLWFYPQHQQQDGDLEEHLIGVPASSMMALVPRMYAVNQLLVGGFVYGKESLDYIEFFQPTANREFSIEMGRNIMKSMNMPMQPGVLYSTAVF